MIYERLDAGVPIRQGDIFQDVPFLELPGLQQISLVRDDEKIQQTSWQDIIEANGDKVACVATIRRVPAIVLTQDCDAVRAAELCLCEIRPFAEVAPDSKKADKPKKFTSFVTRQSRLNQKWLYLPPDPSIGFEVRMGVDFFAILRIPRPDLEGMRAAHRVGCLTRVARQHFRERVAEFFRRYPYDEWYPLSREEFAAYRESAPDADPFPWQRS